MTPTELRAATRKHVKRARDFYGTWRKLTDMYNTYHGTDLTYQAIYRWYETGDIPVERAVQLEQLTGGVIAREDLRPDLYTGFIREAQCANG